MDSDAPLAGPRTQKFLKSISEHLMRFTPVRRQEMIRAGEAVVAEAEARRAARQSARPTPPKPAPKR